MTAAVLEELGQLQLLDLKGLEVSPLNPRKDVGDLTELAASIKEIGVVEPIVAVRRNGGYQIIAGSRRAAASRLAGKTQVPARIMSLDEAQQAAAALIENLQRLDLSPLEEANAYRQYLDLTGCTQKELGEKVGRAPSTIANALRLLNAPAKLQAALTDGAVGAAHARELLKLEDETLFAQVKLTKGINKALKEAAADGFVEIKERAGVHGSIRQKLATDLAAYDPSEQDIEQTYAACIAALAGAQAAAA